MTDARRETLSVSGDVRWLLTSVALTGLGEGLAIAGASRAGAELLGAALVVWALSMLAARALTTRAHRRAQRAGLLAIGAGAVTPWALALSSFALGLPLALPLALGASARVAIQRELAHRLRPEHASHQLSAVRAMPLVLGALGAASVTAPRFPSTRASALALLLAGLAALAATLRGGPGRPPARGRDAIAVVALLALMAAGAALGTR